MKDKNYDKIIFYLYNYNNIDNLIKKREIDIIDSTNITSNAWVKSIKENENTLENQAIKLAEDTQIIEYKQWQVFIKGILVFLCKNKPICYKYLYLKYFLQKNNEEIIRTLKINLKELKELKAKLIEFIYKNAQNRNLI